MIRTNVRSIMALLKESTADLHTKAESHPYQQRLIHGAISRDEYLQYLTQMFFVHQALENALRAVVERGHAIAMVVRDFQYQEPYLVEDLRYFGVDMGAIKPLAVVSQFRAAIDRDVLDNPLRLLGYHYVLEGSNNGSKFISKAVKKCLALNDGRGLRYLDPYGDQQREYWMQFKQDMDSIDFNPGDGELLVSAARDMFAWIYAISDGLSSKSGESGESNFAGIPGRRGPVCPHAR